jgi:hypothetical protein
MANEGREFDEKGRSQTPPGLNAGDANVYTAENLKRFKELNQPQQPEHQGSQRDIYGFTMALGQTYGLALGTGLQLKESGLRPSSLILGAAVGVGNQLIDQQLFKGVDRKAPGYIADAATLGIALTPQPVYMRAIEMVGVHTVGRYLDKLLS